MPAVSSKDYFGSFLTSVSETPSGSLASATDAPIQDRILSLLTTEEKPLSLRSLIDHLSLSPSLAVRMIETLQQANLVSMSSGSSEECVEITDLGRRLAK